MVPYFKTKHGILYYGDAIDIPTRIEKNSVHCVITSPPYWGKVAYTDNLNQLGLEKTPKLFIEQMVDIFRGIKEVLHPSGTVWLNIGDTNCVPSTKREGELGMKPGVPAKNRIGIPWKLAFALQEDGWWLRGDNIWYRRNAPREPVKDRPTYEHEYVFLLTKKAHYFYDQVAVYQPLKTGDRYAGNRRKKVTESGGMFDSGHNRKAKIAGRNLGSVWDIPTEGRTDAHYAAFPSKLVARCIKAGTSREGCCTVCNAPYKRIIERSNEDNIPTTTGWEPTCKCHADKKPCTILDPFMGRGTTALVAAELKRKWVGVELNDESCELIKQNVINRKVGLLPVVKTSGGLLDLNKIDISITEMEE
jgi:DNA modification methylase